MGMPPVLMVASGAIVGVLGLLHLVFTFRGEQLRPRDPALVIAMREVQPGITTQTNVWNMWLGFNASHSLGAMLFGLVYGYLALAHGDVLFSSVFLQVVGFAMLAGLAELARRYWFIVPLTGISLSLLLYVASLALSWSV